MPGLICVPVIARQISEIISQITLANEIADAIELRLDYFYPIQTYQLRHILSQVKKPVILTCRMEKEGGKFSGPENERASFLEDAIELSNSSELYVDIELDSQEQFMQKILKAANSKNAKVIVSKHFFSSTPSDKILESVFEKAQNLGPFAVKIVTFAKKPSDNARMLKFLKKHSGGKTKIICFCMGKIGQKSRVLAALNGSYLNYTSLDEKSASAPGQIAVGKFRKLLGN